MKAKISEIFVSYQGEGPFTGSRQLFIRFYGCNFGCVYCDTVLSSYKSFSEESLLGKILDFQDDYNELTVTGGEPLEYAAFLEGFLPIFKKHGMAKVYLETNGTLPDELAKILENVDIISMDFKLPSSCGKRTGLWHAHKKFLDLALQKELIVKAVITDSTTIDDIKIMSRILAETGKEFPVILQPVTPAGDLVKEPDEEMLSYFKGYIAKEMGNAPKVMAQAHKYLGIR